MNKMLVNMSREELKSIEGGLVAGIVVGGLNGFAIGVASALIGACIYGKDWTSNDSMNMLKSYTVAGVCLGMASPI